MKPTNKKLKELITEEKQASKMYKRYGFGKIAKQESHHAKTLNEVLKRRN